MSDRASRLREKRNKSKQKVRSEASEASRTSKPSKTSETEETAEPEKSEEKDESDESLVKNERVGTYLYLSEEQRDEMRYRYKILSAEYEREFGDELEKNRHYYPLVVQYGLDGLDDCDAQDVREMLDGLED